MNPDRTEPNLLDICLDKKITLKTIDVVLYDNKKQDFEYLIQHLDQDQRFHFAVLLYEAIQADDRVHPAELRYMQNINQLLGNEEANLEMLDKEGVNPDFLPELNLANMYSDYLFTQLVEIVLCDEEYDSKESDFITKAAKILGIKQSRQNQVEQTMATALIAKSALFS